MSRVRSWLADPVAAGLTAGALLALVEVARLGALTRPGLALTVIALAAVAGTFTGAAVAAAVAVADRLRARGVARAAILAAPALAITIPVGGSLFEGAFAATLPGARWAPIAVPALGWLGLAAAIAIGQRLVAAGPRARGLVVAALALGGLVVEAANRALFRSGYPTLHLGLVFAAIAAIAAALAVGLGRPPAPRRGRLITGAAIAVVAVVVALIALMLLETTPSLSTPMIYKKQGLTMANAAAPGLAVLAIALTFEVRRDWRRALVAQLALPVAATVAVWIVTGASGLWFGERVCPVVPRWSGWLPPLTIISATALAVAGLVVLASAVLPGSGPSTPSGTSRSDRAGP